MYVTSVMIISQQGILLKKIILSLGDDIMVEVEFECETEVGDVEIECPLCNGDGNLYAKKMMKDKNKCEFLLKDTGMCDHNERRVQYPDKCDTFRGKHECPNVTYERIDCISCGSLGKLEVFVGETLVSGTTEVEFEPSYNEGFD